MGNWTDDVVFCSSQAVAIQRAPRLAVLRTGPRRGVRVLHRRGGGALDVRAEGGAAADAGARGVGWRGGRAERPETVGLGSARRFRRANVKYYTRRTENLSFVSVPTLIRLFIISRGKACPPRPWRRPARPRRRTPVRGRRRAAGAREIVQLSRRPPSRPPRGRVQLGQRVSTELGGRRNRRKILLCAPAARRRPRPGVLLRGRAGRRHGRGRQAFPREMI